MPGEVSEAQVETAQVEEKPSEEPQVAEPTPSEAEKPAQEPEAEKPPEESSEEREKRILQEVLDSDDYKKSVQSEADKRALKLRQEFEARERETQRKAEQDTRLAQAQQKRESDLNTYRQLQALKQTKPEEWQAYMDQPQYAAIWNQGLNTTPSTVEIDTAKSDGYNDGFNQLWGQIYQGFMNDPAMGDLSTEEQAALSRDKFQGEANPHAAYTLALAKVYGTRLAKAGFKKEIEKAVEDARADEREKLQTKYREAGIEPADIEGKTAPGVLTEAQYLAMSPDDREKLQNEHPERIDAMTRKMQGN